jgi:hypothetical protein
MNLPRIWHRCANTLFLVSPLLLYGTSFCLLTAITLTWYFLCAIPLQASIVASSHNRGALQREKLTWQKRTRCVDDIRGQIQNLEALLNEKKALLPEGIGVSKQEIDKHLKSFCISVNAITLGKAQSYTGFTVIPMGYALTGSYENFVQFFTALRNQQVLCSELTMKPFLNGISCSLVLVFLHKSLS